ncbi:hypothetical protein [Virgibacillus ainsalahensis]
MNKKEKELYKLGKKHQKWLEETKINANAYQLNGHSYYFTIYEGKFNTKVKGHAIISPDSNNREEALESLKPHIYFVISTNNLKDAGSKRAQLDHSVWMEIRDYLKRVLEAGAVQGTNKIIYQRSLDILNAMIELQEEMVELWKNAGSLKTDADEKGFFSDEQVKKALDYIVKGDLIQYKQFKERYDYCEDFDLIYKNRNDAKVQPYQENLDSRILQGMTSEAAEEQLKNSLDRVTKNQYFDNMNEDQIYEKLMATYCEGLDERVRQAKEILRYP